MLKGSCGSQHKWIWNLLAQRENEMGHVLDSQHSPFDSPSGGVNSASSSYLSRHTVQRLRVLALSARSHIGLECTSASQLVTNIAAPRDGKTPDWTASRRHSRHHLRIFFAPVAEAVKYRQLQWEWYTVPHFVVITRNGKFTVSYSFNCWLGGPKRGCSGDARFSSAVTSLSSRSISSHSRRTSRWVTDVDDVGPSGWSCGSGASSPLKDRSGSCARRWTRGSWACWSRGSGACWSGRGAGDIVDDRPVFFDGTACAWCRRRSQRFPWGRACRSFHSASRVTSRLSKHVLSQKSRSPYSSFPNTLCHQSYEDHRKGVENDDLKRYHLFRSFSIFFPPSRST